MKHRLSFLFVCLALLCALSPGLAQAAYAADDCTRIKDGIVTDVTGHTLILGYDRWGYNYQAHMFNGPFDNHARPIPPVIESDTNLIMKWSDDWLSNKDCDRDGKLDRGGADSDSATNTSKGWLTNHQEGDYEEGGEYYHWTYFVKIVYVGPVPGGTDPWADTRLWGQYAAIERVLNDPHKGLHGVMNLVKPAGFGFWTN